MNYVTYYNKAKSQSLAISKYSYMKVDKDLDSCNFCKTILMLSIIMFHSGMFWTRKWFTLIEPADSFEELVLFTEWLGTFHIYAFTLISGYIFYHLRNERKEINNKYNNLSNFIRLKLKRLIIPYIFVSIVWVIPFAEIFWHYSPQQIVYRFLLGTSPNQLWFLLMLFGVFIIAYISFTYKALNNTKTSFLYVIFLYFIGIKLGGIMPNYFQFPLILINVLFFWIGYTLRKNYKYIPQNILTKYGIGLLLLNIFTFYLLKHLYLPVGFITNLIRVTIILLCTSSGAIMAFFLLIYLSRIIKWHNNRFKTITKASFPMYLFHQQFIYIFLYFLNGHLSAAILYIISFIGSLILSYIISSLLMKNKYTRSLIN